MIQVIVRPIDAVLTHDTETFGRMVKLVLSSPPTVRYIWEASTSELNQANSQERILVGTINSISAYPWELIP